LTVQNTAGCILMIDILDIINSTYRKLRRPSELALPYQDAIDTINEIITKRKLDLTLTNQNTETKISDWIQPQNYSEISLPYDLLLPLRVERIDDSIYCGYQFGQGIEVPIVNYEVLDNAYSAVAFYGTPFKMAINRYLWGYWSTPGCYYALRIKYQPDFSSDAGIDDSADLPSFFTGFVSDEAVFTLIDRVDDNSPEWLAYVAAQNKKLPVLLADWEQRWQDFIKLRRGKKAIKTTMLDNQRNYGNNRFYGRRGF
jgi:hypothetical protein